MNVNLSMSTIIYAVKLGIAAALAYILGIHVSGGNLPVLKQIGGLWSVISAVVVLRKGYIESYKSGFERLLVNLIGCIIGAIYLFFFETLWFFPLAIFATALVCYIGMKAYYPSAAIACSVVVIVWQIGHPQNVWIYSLSRFVESGVGIFSAVLLAHLPPYSKKGST